MVGIAESLAVAMVVITYVTVFGLKTIDHQKQSSKLKSTNSEIKKMTTRKLLAILLPSILLGIVIRMAVDYPYTINWQTASTADFLLGFTSALYGYTGFYLFTILSMAVAILSSIPPIATRLHGPSIPVIRGVTIGFGIMILYQLFTHGIPRIIH
jgi:hypothetical protein